MLPGVQRPLQLPLFRQAARAWSCCALEGCCGQRENGGDRSWGQGCRAHDHLSVTQNLRLSKDLQDGRWVLGEGHGTWIPFAPLTCALSRGASSIGLLTSSDFGGQRPSWLFLTFLPLEPVKIVSSMGHADRVRFFIFPLNSWLAILHNTKQLLMK